MSAPEWLSSRDDLEEIVRLAFPFLAPRFCLYVPSDTKAATSAGRRLRIEETAEAFVLVVQALVYRDDTEPDGTRRIESIREQRVRLVSRAALPLGRERLVSYLRAVERCLGEQAFGSVAKLHPSRWFNADLLEMPSLNSVEAFHAFLAASLPVPPRNAPSPLVLASVLLDEPQLPTAKAVQDAYAAMAPHGGKGLRALRSAGEMLEFEVGNGAHLAVTLMPVSIAGGEVEAAERLSVARFVNASPMKAHRAHLLVTLTSEKETPVERLTALVRFAAAIASATNAVGVYCNGVAHPAGFFVDQARADFTMMLLCGVIVIGGGHERCQLLSRGMKQLGLPELLVKTAGAVDGNALGLFFELVALVARSREPIPPRDTVGRDAHEKLRVRYEPSPEDATVPVWSVDLGGPALQR